MPKRKKSLPQSRSHRHGLSKTDIKVMDRMLMWQREIWPALFQNGSHKYRHQADLSRDLGFGSTASNGWFSGIRTPMLGDFMLMMLMLKADPAKWLPSRAYLLGREKLPELVEVSDLGHAEVDEITVKERPAEDGMNDVVNELATRLKQQLLERVTEKLLDEL